MKYTFYEIMVWYQSICMILSFLFSLRLINNNKVVHYMRYFYWYSIVGGLIAIFRITTKKYGFPSEDIMAVVSNYSVLFHFTFLSWFIHTLMPNRNEFKLSIFVFVTIFCITLFFLILYPEKQQNSTSYAMGNIGLIIFCIIYFYQLFQTVPKLNLLKEPSFWIITGVFVCMSVSIPILSLHQFLRDENYINPESRKIFSGLVYLAYGSFHLFLLKAYVCSTPQQKILSF